MAQVNGDSENGLQWTVVDTDSVQPDQVSGPLLVAMQPGSGSEQPVDEIKAEEVLIMTENGETMTFQEFQSAQEAMGGEVTVGAVEEVVQESEINQIEQELPVQLQFKNEYSEQLQLPTSSRSAHTYRSRLTNIDRAVRRSYPDRLAPMQLTSMSSSEDSSDEEHQQWGIPPPGHKIYSRYGRTIPKKREFAHRLQWNNKDMLEAMREVEEKKMSIRGAAKRFSVPYSTLKDRVHGRVAHGVKPGVKTALSPEEELELVKYIKDMENAGFQLRCIDVRDRAGEILRINHGHNSPYKDCSPGHNWLAGFLKRNPGLEFKKSMMRNTVPSVPKQKAMVRKFYDVAAHTYKKYKLYHRSERVFAVADLRVHAVQEASVLMCVAADGSALPPFVVFKGQRLKLTAARQAYPEAFFTCSHNGRVNEDIFLWWFRDHFLKKVQTGSGRPCVLYISRPVNDITFQLLQLAKDERVMLIAIPTGISHLLQPIDDELGHAMENSIHSKSNKWSMQNEGTPFTQKVLAEMLKSTWSNDIDQDDIQAKFQNNGLFPLNPAAITQDRIQSAALVLRDTLATRSPSPPPTPELSGLNLLSALSSHEYVSMAGDGDVTGAASAAVTSPSEDTMDTMDTYNMYERYDAPRAAPRPYVVHRRGRGRGRGRPRKHAPFYPQHRQTQPAARYVPQPRIEVKDEAFLPEGEDILTEEVVQEETVINDVIEEHVTAEDLHLTPVAPPQPAVVNSRRLLQEELQRAKLNVSAAVESILDPRKLGEDVAAVEAGVADAAQLEEALQEEVLQAEQVLEEQNLLGDVEDVKMEEVATEILAGDNSFEDDGSGGRLLTDELGNVFTTEDGSQIMLDEEDGNEVQLVLNDDGTATLVRKPKPPPVIQKVITVKNGVIQVTEQLVEQDPNAKPPRRGHQQIRVIRQ